MSIDRFAQIILINGKISLTLFIWIKICKGSKTIPVDLYLNFEKSSLTNWIFVGYTGSKNQVRKRLKIQFVQLDFFKLIFQKSSTD